MVMGDPRQSQHVESGHARAPVTLAHEQSFRIGDVEVRPATREICRAGETAVIEPRVMQVLIALHRADGAVVNKDDLLQSCWAGRIVGEDAINRIISRLRSVADREAGGQFRIETITKVGYRLLSASGDPLKAAIGASRPLDPSASSKVASAAPHRRVIAVALLLPAMVTGAWFWLRPVPVAAHNMTVRLAGFLPLTKGLPISMPEKIGAEIASAFSTDGVIGISTLPSPSPGTAPAYKLDGTVDRVGDALRVNTRFTNERTGAVLWSDSVDYPVDQVAHIPQKIAADAGTVVRCGLSGAATHDKPLPDPVLSNYMQYCQQYWAYGGTKTLRFAQLVVAAVPDFSWGWSAVGNGYMQAANIEADSRRADALRAAGRQAEDKALSLDPRNSEALGHKAHMLDLRDWMGREILFKRAIAARPLDCGCEFMGYGWHLERVGRLDAAITQYRAATDTLALWPDSQIALASSLVAVGRADQAGPHFRAAVDLSKDPHLGEWIAMTYGSETGEHAAAIAALRNPKLQLSDENRAALLLGYTALVSGAQQAKTRAVGALVAVPPTKRNEATAKMLAALGATGEALRSAADQPALFWQKSMRGVLNEPGFPDVAKRLRLFEYWRVSRTKPDICLAKDAPPFCRMI